MSYRKRLFDLCLAGLLCLALAPLFLSVLLLVWIAEGRPIFFGSERMAAPDRAFRLWKFRTMRLGSDDGCATGGDKRARVTRVGAWLRRTRLDEIPQLWNILRGDMSFVGPRPPLRRYVEACPDLYAQVLRSQVGVTGLASVIFCEHEARLMADCRTAAEADQLYMRRCVARKARLDLIYQRRASLRTDLWVIGRTCNRFCHSFRLRRFR